MSPRTAKRQERLRLLKQRLKKVSEESQLKEENESLRLYQRLQPRQPEQIREQTQVELQAAQPPKKVFDQQTQDWWKELIAQAPDFVRESIDLPPIPERKPVPRVDD